MNGYISVYTSYLDYLGVCLELDNSFSFDVSLLTCNFNTGAIPSHPLSLPVPILILFLLLHLLFRLDRENVRTYARTYIRIDVR